jgi:hypothetical protein
MKITSSFHYSIIPMFQYFLFHSSVIPTLQVFMLKISIAEMTPGGILDFGPIHRSEV